ncbi:hypothetical protein AVEN_43554-1 [Araneus ventricosus]|uniref:Uncharacterized protein n=1 Tax=Araneus ventricosus TaxID=182803 RepID=A0A4Y2EI65_ARAVE|nr:hypothetical protein AVEN_43554-1 [Araneus ventricosus]
MSHKYAQNYRKLKSEESSREKDSKKPKKSSSERIRERRRSTGLLGCPEVPEGTRHRRGLLVSPYPRLIPKDSLLASAVFSSIQSCKTGKDGYLQIGIPELSPWSSSPST